MNLIYTSKTKEDKKMFNVLNESISDIFTQVTEEMDDSLDKISEMVPGIKENNPGLIEEMLKILEG